MLPTTTLTSKCGSRTRKVRCLISSGSQRSYLSESFAKLIRPDISNIYKLNCDVNTYMGQDTKEFGQMSTGIKIGQKLVFVPLLIDRTFKLTYNVPGLSAVINRFKENNMVTENGEINLHVLIELQTHDGKSVRMWQMPHEHSNCEPKKCSSGPEL